MTDNNNVSKSYKYTITVVQFISINNTNNYTALYTRFNSRTLHHSLVTPFQISIYQRLRPYHRPHKHTRLFLREIFVTIHRILYYKVFQTACTSITTSLHTILYNSKFIAPVVCTIYFTYQLTQSIPPQPVREKNE